MRRQLSLSSASRFYAEVVNRQAALHRVGSKKLPDFGQGHPSKHVHGHALLLLLEVF